MNFNRPFRVAFFVLAGFLLSLAAAAPGTAAAKQAIPIEVRVMPKTAEIGPNETIQVAIEIVDVSDLYAFSLALAFDPEVVEVVDTDPAINGVQVGFGTFMDPGAVLINLADNPAGVIEFAFTQLNPSPPQSGTGNLIVITFRGLQEGESTPLIFLDVQLAQTNGVSLDAVGIPGQIQVTGQNDPGPSATPIPTQDGGIPFPTATLPANPQPTNTPVALPTNTGAANTPLPTATAVSNPTTPTTTPNAGSQPTSTSPPGVTPEPGNTAVSQTGPSMTATEVSSPPNATGQSETAGGLSTGEGPSEAVTIPQTNASEGETRITAGPTETNERDNISPIGAGDVPSSSISPNSEQPEKENDFLPWIPVVAGLLIVLVAVGFKFMRPR